MAPTPISNFDFFFEGCVESFLQIETVQRTLLTILVLFFFGLLTGWGLLESHVPSQKPFFIAPKHSQGKMIAANENGS